MAKLIKFGILCFAFSAGNLLAEEEVDPCNQIHELASKVMEARQLGVSMPDMMKLAVSGNQEEAKVGKSMILDAYDNPQYSGDEYQKKEIKRFANDWALKCYKQS